MSIRAVRLLCALQLLAATGCVSSTPATPSAVPSSGGLWLSAQPRVPTGMPCSATTGRTSPSSPFSRDLFSSPTLEEVRIFDLLD
jgi:hypothetical protein